MNKLPIGEITIETNAGQQKRPISADDLFGCASRTMMEIKVHYQEKKQIEDILKFCYHKGTRSRVNSEGGYVSLLAQGLNFYQMLQRHGAKLSRQQRENFLKEVPTEIHWIP